MKLVADRLTLVRGTRTLQSDLSFAVETGSALLITGANGVGKSTLLRAVAGLFPAAAGRVRLEGAAEPDAVAEAVHYFGHLNAVKSSLTVEENVRFWCGYLGGRTENVATALETFGLLPLRDIPAGYLSAGQKRRLGLARLLVAERPVWLLDEPATSLDVASQAVVAGVVNRHLGRGGIVLAATHSPLGLAPAAELVLEAAA
jgi:heme exporter protein A